MGKKELITKKCKYCGEEFKTTRKQHVFCKTKCSTSWYKENKKDYSNKTPYLKVRFAVLERDGFTCQYCGRGVKDGVKLEVEHLRPRSKGGTNEYINLVTSCQECNLGKSDVLLSQRQEYKQKQRILKETTRKIKTMINKNQNWQC